MPFDARPYFTSFLDTNTPVPLTFKTEPAARFTQILSTHTGVIIGENPQKKPHAFVWDGSSVIDPALASKAPLSKYGIRQLWAVRAEQRS